MPSASSLPKMLSLSRLKLKKSFFWDFYLIIFISIILGFFWEYIPQLGGTVGYEMNLSTHRCRKICPHDKERSLHSGRCIKKCQKGYKHHSRSGHCVPNGYIESPKKKSKLEQKLSASIKRNIKLAAKLAVCRQKLESSKKRRIVPIPVPKHSSTKKTLLTDTPMRGWPQTEKVYDDFLNGLLKRYGKEGDNMNKYYAW